jgi:hypothetical protein
VDTFAADSLNASRFQGQLWPNSDMYVLVLSGGKIRYAKNAAVGAQNKKKNTACHGPVSCIPVVVSLIYSYHSSEELHFRKAVHY